MARKSGKSEPNFAVRWRLVSSGSGHAVEPCRFDLKPTGHGQILFEQMQLLEPKNDRQAAIMAQAFPLILGLRQTQWLMFLKTEQSAIPLPLLLVLVSWLAAIFFSFGLFAVPDTIVFVADHVEALETALIQIV
jgi:hypothetical protein